MGLMNSEEPFTVSEIARPSGQLIHAFCILYWT